MTLWRDELTKWKTVEVGGDLVVAHEDAEPIILRVVGNKIVERKIGFERDYD